MGVPGAERVLSVAFESAEAFQQEYAANLVNGGVFVATDELLELRTRVQVKLLLRFCGKQIAFAGEVVHQVTPEMAELGAPAGVAVEFDTPADQVRALLEPLRVASGAPEPSPSRSGKRGAPRTAAHVPARVTGGDGELEGHTRNLSRSGVLVSVPGQGVPVGEKVRLSLSHPTSGESMDLEGVVVRQVEDDGVSALGIQFVPSAETERFVEGIQSTEHVRRLGGISGGIAELGVVNLLQMFAGTAPAGTLTLRNGEQEGVVGFEGGLLRFVRLGGASGLKALGRLVGWSEGSFEFHACLDAVEPLEVPLPLEAALLEAVVEQDEFGRSDRGCFRGDAIPRVADAVADQDDLSKVEAAVLDLARAGFTVRRMVDFIPEPDAEIYRALESLSDRGALSF
jgi:Tfp pilus assembly protein PilZ